MQQQQRALLASCCSLCIYKNGFGVLNDNGGVPDVKCNYRSYLWTTNCSALLPQLLYPCKPCGGSECCCGGFTDSKLLIQSLGWCHQHSLLQATQGCAVDKSLLTQHPSCDLISQALQPHPVRTDPQRWADGATKRIELSPHLGT